MPRYAYQKPRAKVYAYNYGYMSNYYKPMTHFLSKEDTPRPIDRPGAQVLAERLKKFPMDGSTYPDRSEINLPPFYRFRDDKRRLSPVAEYVEPDVVVKVPASNQRRSIPIFVRQPYRMPVDGPGEKILLQVAAPTEEERKVYPLRLKHPYRLPVEDERKPWTMDPIWFRHPWDWECIWVPPHESRSTPHFGLEAYRSLIDKFLRLRPNIKELTCY